jgi:hypothetical protein
VQPPGRCSRTGEPAVASAGDVNLLGPVCDSGYVYTATNSLKNTYDVKFNTSAENNIRKDVKCMVRADESRTTTYGCR